MPVRLLVKSRAPLPEGVPPEVLLEKDTIVVGREQGCDLVLTDPVVSRKHLNIVRDGKLYFLEDAGSSYGTRVNGAVLPKGEKRLLRNGDTIAVGPYDLVFDRVADEPKSGEKTSFLAKAVVKSALRGLSGVVPVLRVMNGPLEGTKIELKDAQELVVGREEDAVDVLFDDDDMVSRKHAKFRRDWDGTHLEDLGSRNGVRVNGKRLSSSHTLHDGDEVEIGRTRLLYLDPSEVRDAPLLEPPPASLGAEIGAGSKFGPAPTEEGASGAEADAASAADPQAEEQPPAQEPPPEAAQEPPQGEPEKASPPPEPEEPEPVEPPPDDGAGEGLASGGYDDLAEPAAGGRATLVQNLVPIIVVSAVAIAALVVLGILFFAT